MGLLSMYIPYISTFDISTFLSRHLMVPFMLLFDKSKFNLDTSGALGVFGGDEAVSAMATVHICEDRRWLGWYNSPGSYQIARQYGRVVSSGFFNRFLPGVSTNPAALFNLDGSRGPKFKGIHSGMVMEETSHLAALFMKECASLQGEKVVGRETQPIFFTVADLDRVPPPNMDLKFLSAYTPIFASIPISASVSACAACVIFQDWCAFAMILLGVLANGFTCLTIGSGKFTFTHPDPAKGCPPGDGILTSDTEVVLLKGTEGAVNCITRGRFSLDFSSKPQYRDIGWCSVLFTIQFIAQLLLIPQASLFGQVMFVASLTVSWIYNLWVSSSNNILFEKVLGKPVVRKYILGTRTTMAIFVLLVLHTAEPSTVLNRLLPNDTKVWRHWKDTILERFCHKDGLVFTKSDWNVKEFTDEENLLLKDLYTDAKAAHDGYALYVIPK